MHCFGYFESSSLGLRSFFFALTLYPCVCESYQCRKLWAVGSSPAVGPTLPTWCTWQDMWLPEDKHKMIINRSVVCLAVSIAPSRFHYGKCKCYIWLQYSWYLWCQQRFCKNNFNSTVCHSVLKHVRIKQPDPLPLLSLLEPWQRWGSLHPSQQPQGWAV